MDKTLIYEVWPIAFIEPDHRGDKRSALRKVIDLLPYIVNVVGANYIWLAPIFLSLWTDHGYDVTNYREIDPRLGTKEELEELIEAAREDGVGILMDLVMNHTSTSNLWFTDHPEYYCWSDSEKHDWPNLFDNGSSWERGKYGYYLHLFSKNQADLNWFPNGPEGKPNPKLVKRFREVVDFWTSIGIKGFRLDAMQCINKNIASSYFSPMETVTKYRELAAKVINAVFKGRKRKKLFLLMECLDLNHEMVRYYYWNTPVKAIMDNTPINTLQITKDQSVTERNLDDYVRSVAAAYHHCPKGYAHVTESHDCPRFTTAAGVGGKRAIDILFGWDGKKYFIEPYTIVVYMGQELGLKNPNKKELPDSKMLELDAETKMRVARGETIDSLRPTSRANARVRVPFEKYLGQSARYDSNVNRYRSNLIMWREND